MASKEPIASLSVIQQLQLQVSKLQERERESCERFAKFKERIDQSIGDIQRQVKSFYMDVYNITRTTHCYIIISTFN